MAEISIVTPVLNQAEYIERCILSVANQQADVEHIIIDAGSTDGTLDIIKKHADKLAYWVSEPDNGQSHAINKGIARCSGKYFNWLNADDEITKGALSEVIQLFEPNVNVVIGQCQHIDVNGNEMAIGSAKLWETVEGTLGNYTMGQPSHFYRIETIKSLGELNEALHYCMDMDLWFRYLIKYGHSGIKLSDKILSQFRLLPLAKSQLESKEMKQENYSVYKALLLSVGMAPELAPFFNTIPSIKEINFEPSQKLDRDRLNAHFAWYLLLKAYEHREMQSAKQYYKVVAQKDRLSITDKLLWKTRLWLRG
ncbi:glycosyltransferase family 2 protein [Bacteroidota bacterium]